MADRKKVGVLISGNGSNLQALIDACKRPDFPAQISVVISNKQDAYGLNRASEAGIPTHVIDHKNYDSREAFDNAVHEMLLHHHVQIVCLAGFMRLLSSQFVERWTGKMLNIHPSILPAFKGAHAHRDVVAAGVRISGCTVHFVSAQMDAGPVIVQAAVPVFPDDTEQTLGARVLEQEHQCYPQALRLLAEDKLSIVNNRVQIQKSTPDHLFHGGVLLNPSI